MHYIGYSHSSAFLDRAIGYGGQPILAEINTIYSELENELLSDLSEMSMLNRKSCYVDE